MSEPKYRENLCIDKTELSEKAFKAIKPILRKSYFNVKYFSYGYDIDSGDLMFFFPVDQIYAMEYARYHFRVELIRAWREAGFKTIGEVELPKYEYRRIGFASLCFILKPIKYNAP